jgi:Zinc-binding dehydrogenase
MTQSRPVWVKTLLLAVAGAVGFWIANFAISLTPVAADYRAGLSITYVPMLIEALAGGLVIGLCVSFGLHRFYRSIPTHTPVLKSLVLCSVALVVVTVAIEVPGKFLTPTTDGTRYFVLATAFNALRLAALGLVIGSLYDRLQHAEYVHDGTYTRRLEPRVDRRFALEETADALAWVDQGKARGKVLVTSWTRCVA